MLSYIIIALIAWWSGGPALYYRADAAVAGLRAPDGVALANQLCADHGASYRAVFERGVATGCAVLATPVDLDMAAYMFANRTIL